MLVTATLFALGTSVFPGPRFTSSPRVVVYVKHEGKPREFNLSVRTKDTKDGEWTYYRSLKHMPIRLRTSSRGRRVMLTLPKDLKKWTQVCALLPPERSPGESSIQFLFSLESCSNLPGHKKLFAF